MSSLCSISGPWLDKWVGGGGGGGVELEYKTDEEVPMKNFSTAIGLGGCMT